MVEKKVVEEKQNIKRDLTKIEDNKFQLCTTVDFNREKLQKEYDTLIGQIDVVEGQIKGISEELKPLDDNKKIIIKTYADLRKINIELERILLQKNPQWEGNKKAMLKGLQEQLVQANKDKVMIEQVLKK